MKRGGKKVDKYCGPSCCMQLARIIQDNEGIWTSAEIQLVLVTRQTLDGTLRVPFAISNVQGTSWKGSRHEQNPVKEGTEEENVAEL